MKILSEQDRVALIASLKEAERRVQGGEAIDYDPIAFKIRLLDICRGTKLASAPTSPE